MSRFAKVLGTALTPLLVVLGIIVLATRGDESESRHFPRLTLNELRVTSLAPDFPIAGAAIDSQGTIIAWSKRASRLLVQAQDTTYFVEYASNEPPLGVRVIRTGQTIEILDRFGRLVTIDYRGRLHSESEVGPWPDSWSLLAGSPDTNGWFLGLFDQRQDFVILYATPGTVPKLIGKLSQDEFRKFLPDSLARVQAHLRPDRNGGVVATLWWQPHKAFRFAADSTRKPILTPPPLIEFGEAEAARSASIEGTALKPILLSLPTIALDSGYLQTVSDLTSDMRWSIVYDLDGRPQRVSALPAAMGFIASDPNVRLLAAARRLNSLQLVLYEWRWTT